MLEFDCPALDCNWASVHSVRTTASLCTVYLCANGISGALMFLCEHAYSGCLPCPLFA